MGIRNILEAHKNFTVIGCVLVVLGGIGYAISQRTSADVPNVKQAFYSTDDGKSWFVDDVDRLSPFDSGGKTAVRVYVWKCHGRKFVNYLERRTDAANQKILELRKRGPVTTDAIAAVDSTGLQVKKPGGDKWVGESDPKFTLIVRPSCPEGSMDDLEPVYP